MCKRVGNELQLHITGPYVIHKLVNYMFSGFSTVGCMYGTSLLCVFMILVCNTTICMSGGGITVCMRTGVYTYNKNWHEVMQIMMR